MSQSYFSIAVSALCETACLLLLTHTVILKEDNTTDRLYLYCLLYMHSMIIKSGVICTSVYLYTIIMGRNRWGNALFF